MKDIDEKTKYVRSEIDNIRKEQIRLYEAQAKDTEGVVNFLAEYKIKPLQFKYDNEIKSIDVLLDILKFIIPISFSVWIATYTVKELSKAANLSTYILVGLVIVMIIVIVWRYFQTKEYIRLFKKSYDVIISRYSASLDMKQTAKTQHVEWLSKRIDRNSDILEEIGVKLEKLKKTFQIPTDQKPKIKL